MKKLLMTLLSVALVGMLFSCGDDGKDETSEMIVGQWKCSGYSVNEGGPQVLDYIRMWEFQADGTFKEYYRDSEFQSTYSVVSGNKITINAYVIDFKSDDGVTMKVDRLDREELILSYTNDAGDDYIIYFDRM